MYSASYSIKDVTLDLPSKLAEWRPCKPGKKTVRMRTNRQLQREKEKGLPKFKKEVKDARKV